MKKTFLYIYVICLCTLLGSSGSAGTINVPQDYPTIQAGINATSDGDTVLIQPGTYVESLTINGTSFTLASLYLTTGNPTYIGSTIIDGGGANRTIYITNTDTLMTIVGLTIRNGGDGIFPTSKLRLLHSRVTDCIDGIDFESGSGGRVAYCEFDNNRDDGIDFDYDAPTVVEYNTIHDNGNDGIETRLHPWTGDTLEYVIRWNVIYNNGFSTQYNNGDGIQLIWYDVPTHRRFTIERNLIYNNKSAGLGFMDGTNTNEDFRAAQITEPVIVKHNVFDGNNHGISGGGNATYVGNIVMNSSVLGAKNAIGPVPMSYNCFWGNATDFQNTATGPGIVLVDPWLNPDYTLQENSPCVDAGPASCTDPDNSICDIGVFYFDQSSLGIEEGRNGGSIPDGYTLYTNYPNPFNPQTTIGFNLPQISHISLSIFDLAGRLVKSLITGDTWRAGSHTVTWDGTDNFGNTLSSGAYFYRMEAEGFDASKKMVLLR